eukprot:TRINITY_DN7155_c0_g1_i1.p1 TRINITY_DN7155_c0_g1~~TRINITY_DN7155_c0_g1_i1.p1  ORF type:complete len:857 (+),score=247.12 TRINITY_DN7155_c0_g1_i1:66-2636(+)
MDTVVAIHEPVKPGERRWRPSWASACAAAALFATAAYGCTRGRQHLVRVGDDRRDLTIDEVISGDLSAQSPTYRWTADGIVFVDGDSVRSLAHASTPPAPTTVVPSCSALKASPASVDPSPGSGRYVLFSNDSEKLWRHSSTARHWVLDTQTSEVRALDAADRWGKQRCVQWSPRSDVAAVAYVVDNNLWYEDVGKGAGAARVTSDGTSGQDPGGVDGSIFNGVPDWVYEEDVLHTGCAMWWSPDGSKLAFLRIDSSKVQEVSIPRFDPKPQSGSDLSWAYTVERRFRYPKSGSTNPAVEVKVWTVADQAQCTVPLQKLSQGVAPEVVARVQWPRQDLLAVRALDREQTEEALTLYSTDKADGCPASSTLGLRRHGWAAAPGKRSTWVPLDPPFLWTSACASGGSSDLHFVVVEPFKGTGTAPAESYAARLYHWNGSGAARVVADLTPSAAAVSVTQLLGATSSDRSALLWFVGAPTSAPKGMATSHGSSSRQVYRAPLCGGGNVQTVSGGPGWWAGSAANDPHDGVLAAVLSQQRGQGYAGADVPRHSLYRLGSNMDEIMVLEDNAALVKQLSGIRMPVRLFFDLPVPSLRTHLSMSVTLPSDFDPTRQHPVLVQVYGGPTSQRVTRAYPNPSFNTFWAASGGIFIEVDNRGTGGREVSFERSLHRQLGQLEAPDQMAAASLFAPFLQAEMGGDPVDSDRMCIWGTSYGGYVAGMVAALGAAPFSSSISVAPVTYWELYNTMYTERFQGSPQSNPEGYRLGGVPPHAENFTAPFLLLHGLADDNVLFGHSAMLKAALIKARVGTAAQQTDFFPNRDHSIPRFDDNGAAATVMYNEMTSFLCRSLRLADSSVYKAC